jgi:hypothetical protein
MKSELAECIALASQRTCPVRIICIASYPSIVFIAPSIEWKPRLAAMRFLMKRDLVPRRCSDKDTPITATTSQLSVTLQFSNGLRICLVTVHVDDAWRIWAPLPNASCRKSLAAIASRLGDNKRSMVSPAESTAGHK